MKITLPLFNQSVRGIMHDVGTFTATPWGAVLRKTRTDYPPATQKTALYRWRFATEITRYTGNLTNSRQALAQTLGQRLTQIATSYPPNRPATPIMSASNPAYNLGGYTLNRTIPGEPPP